MKAVNDDMQCPGPVGYVGLTLVFGIEVAVVALAHLLVNGCVNVAFLAVAVPLSCCTAAGGAKAAEAAMPVAQGAPGEP
jgi:hypothetical protein